MSSISFETNGWGCPLKRNSFSVIWSLPSVLNNKEEILLRLLENFRNIKVSYNFSQIWKCLNYLRLWVFGKLSSNRKMLTERNVQFTGQVDILHPITNWREFCQMRLLDWICETFWNLSVILSRQLKVFYFFFFVCYKMSCYILLSVCVHSFHVTIPQ